MLAESIAAQHNATRVWNSLISQASKPPQDPGTKPHPNTLRTIYAAHMDDWLEYARAEPRTAFELQRQMRHLSGCDPRPTTIHDWAVAHGVEMVDLRKKTGLSKLGGEMLRMRMAGADLGEIAAWCGTQGFDVGRRQVSSALMHEKRSRR